MIWPPTPTSEVLRKFTMCKLDKTPLHLTFDIWTGCFTKRVIAEILGAFSRTSAVVGLENGDFGPQGRSISALPDSGRAVVNDLVVGVDGRITSPRITQWIQYKLGKQYL